MLSFYFKATNIWSSMVGKQLPTLLKWTLIISISIEMNISTQINYCVGVKSPRVPLKWIKLVILMTQIIVQKRERFLLIIEEVK